MNWRFHQLLKCSIGKLSIWAIQRRTSHCHPEANTWRTLLKRQNTSYGECAGKHIIFSIPQNQRLRKPMDSSHGTRHQELTSWSPSKRVLLTCEAARRARHHARRARHRNFLNFYIYTFVKVILGNHFLINWQLSNKASADQCHMTISRFKCRTHRGYVFF